MTGRLFDSVAARNAALVRVGAVAAAFAAVAVGVAVFAPRLADPAWVRSAVESTGPFAPLVFVGIQTLQVVFAPIPGQALAAVGGYLFGTVAGTAYSMVGVVAGSAIVFLLARRFGRPVVERLVADDVLARFDGFADRRGVAGLFVLFLLPAFPDDALCALAGLSPLRLRTLVVLVAVGRLPTFALAAAAGQSAGAANYEAVALLVGISVVASAVVYRYRDELATRVG
ncbi:TVP38/TMEM64 family protein [Haloferax sp. Atlit-12N]|uniref:TVP38/TMEM64 family protein n=1 Tax=Haloferax sp. Atlit-12N TaxID=2077203 RepID=UPI000E288784|nr:TVP38/TMEM64 family protein [Haloferax sp. Atlit-12N]RDZ64020.1 TVP38/TMEM64 family protein [Haloferax sp. Atlit-12N]